MENRQPLAPLLTLKVHEALIAAHHAGRGELRCSLDLDRTETLVRLDADGWECAGQRYPFLQRCKERTIYYWTGTGFEVVSRYSGALIKLVPTEWGAPTFEIDGIKMLPTAKLSPWEDARHKVGLIAPQGKMVLDCCGGLGYFAAWCLSGAAARVISFEKNPDVLWLRGLNPWSPPAGGALQLTLGDVTAHLPAMQARSVDAVLHDPPRFGIAGELYSQQFYGELARVLRPGGRMFHYTGAPNKASRGRDLPAEVAARLRQAGFSTDASGDGVLAVRRR